MIYESKIFAQWCDSVQSRCTSVPEGEGAIWTDITRTDIFEGGSKFECCVCPVHVPWVRSLPQWQLLTNASWHDQNLVGRGETADFLIHQSALCVLYCYRYQLKQEVFQSLWNSWVPFYKLANLFSYVNMEVLLSETQSPIPYFSPWVRSLKSPVCLGEVPG
jgi:hypothetical protein